MLTLQSQKINSEKNASMAQYDEESKNLGDLLKMFSERFNH
jgi:hypothetical protein